MRAQPDDCELVGLGEAKRRWVRKYGPVPKGLWVLHKCDQSRCARLDHVYIGTPDQNRADTRRDPVRGDLAGVVVGRVPDATIRVAVRAETEYLMSIAWFPSFLTACIAAATQKVPGPERSRAKAGQECHVSDAAAVYAAADITPWARVCRYGGTAPDRAAHATPVAEHTTLGDQPVAQQP
jgi:hypothetical protein